VRHTSSAMWSCNGTSPGGREVPAHGPLGVRARREAAAGGRRLEIVEIVGDDLRSGFRQRPSAPDVLGSGLLLLAPQQGQIGNC
jgi:hypothetical protein